MGVKNCSRTECDNIMCDRYSTDFGYICNECFEELVGLKPIGERSIEVFMRSPRKTVEMYSMKRQNLEAIFKEG